MTPWKGKWALVTGASAGIGVELAKQLAAGGANLVLTARRTERLVELARELGGRHQIQTEIVSADLAKPEGPEEIFHFTQSKGLPIEVLINNAGFGAYGDFQHTDTKRLLGMVQVNVTSVVHLTHLYLPAMIERRFGYIMIVASTAAFQAVPYMGVYGATKGFDRLFGTALAEEVRAQGVRISTLCPGSTTSEFNQVSGSATQQRNRPQESAEKVARVGLDALAEGKPLVISGLFNRLSIHTQRIVPSRWVTMAVARMFRPQP